MHWTSRALVGLGLGVSACGGAAHVRNGGGCVDERNTVVLQVPPSGEKSDPAIWVIHLPAPLSEGQAVRIARSALGAEYREGFPEPSFASTDVDGILKRTGDDGELERYAIQAVAKHPTIDTRGVGKRGIEGKFAVRRAAACN